MNSITTNREVLFLLLNTTYGEVIAVKTNAGTAHTTKKNADRILQQGLTVLTLLQEPFDSLNPVL